MAALCSVRIQRMSQLTRLPAQWIRFMRYHWTMMPAQCEGSKVVWVMCIIPLSHSVVSESMHHARYSSNRRIQGDNACQHHRRRLLIMICNSTRNRYCGAIINMQYLTKTSWPLCAISDNYVCGLEADVVLLCCDVNVVTEGLHMRNWVQLQLQLRAKYTFKIRMSGFVQLEYFPALRASGCHPLVVNTHATHS